MLDADDLRIIGQGFILMLALLLVAVTVAGTLGLAVRVFEFVSGF